jgi:hypothetical protein
MSLHGQGRGIDLDQLGRLVSTHAGSAAEGIASLGRCGMMVPAVTISPSLNLVRAKSLASACVTNVFVKRGCRRLNTVPFVGTSKVTYHVCLILRRRRSRSRPSSSAGLDPCRSGRTLVRCKSLIVTIAVRLERNVVDVRSHSPLGLEQVTPCTDRKREQEKGEARPLQHDPHHLALDVGGQIASIIGAGTQTRSPSARGGW